MPILTYLIQNFYPCIQYQHLFLFCEKGVSKAWFRSQKTPRLSSVPASSKVNWKILEFTSSLPLIAITCRSKVYNVQRCESIPWIFALDAPTMLVKLHCNVKDSLYSALFFSLPVRFWDSMRSEFVQCPPPIIEAFHFTIVYKRGLLFLFECCAKITKYSPLLTMVGKPVKLWRPSRDTWSSFWFTIFSVFIIKISLFFYPLLFIEILSASSTLRNNTSLLETTSSETRGPTSWLHLFVTPFVFF